MQGRRAAALRSAWAVGLTGMVATMAVLSARAAPDPVAATRTEPSAADTAMAAADAGATPAPPVQPSPSITRLSPDAARALELHDEARGLYVRGHYREALDKLQKALKLEPDEKDLHYITAFVAEKLGELELALEHYRECARLEKDAEELERLRVIIRRVEGASEYAGFAEVPAPPSPPPAKASPAPSMEPELDFGPWPYVAAAVAGSALLFGGIMAANAVAADPGSNVTTSPVVSIEDLQADARGAHTSAVVADVAFTIAGVSGAVALALVIIEQVQRADRVDRNQQKSDLTFSRDGRLRVHF